MKMLNIACGKRYHKDCINIDFHSDSKFVKKVNILCGLPFESDSFDVVYSSHFLEHLNVEQAEFILREAYRVLKKGGIIRIVVPDLENICKEYINVLDELRKFPENEFITKKYKWITIELLDQLVRVKPGGKMLEIFNEVKKSNDNELASYILYRTGDDIIKKKKHKTRNQIKNYLSNTTIDRIKNKLLYLYLNLIRQFIPKGIRDLVINQTTIGEKHQWMYDEYSLKLLLKKIGFINIERKAYNKSNILNFNQYYLDINPDGTPYKGTSSLYMEGFK